MLNVLIGFFAVFLSSVVWQHIARKLGSEIKPSIVLWNMVDPAQRLFLWLGTWLAHLSSFYTYLKKFCGELFISISELLIPVGQLCISPLFFVKGYFDTAMTYKYYLLVLMGTSTLLFAVYSVVSYFLVRYSYIGQKYYILPYPHMF